MSNFVYSKFKNSLLSGQINLISNTVKVKLLNNSYVQNQTSHEFVSDIPSNCIEASSNALTNKIILNNSFTADDIVIENYNGNGFKSLVLYIDTGSSSTSKLIAYVDNATGLPFVNSLNTTVDITIVWSDELTGILSI